jgi:hypothetical protein
MKEQNGCRWWKVTQGPSVRMPSGRDNFERSSPYPGVATKDVGLSGNPQMLILDFIKQRYKY